MTKNINKTHLTKQLLGFVDEGAVCTEMTDTAELN